MHFNLASYNALEVLAERARAGENLINRKVLASIMARFLSKQELYPTILNNSANAKETLWICSPYLGLDSHEVFSPKIMETPPKDIQFVFRLNMLSVRRGEVNPYEIEYFMEHFRRSSIRTNDAFHSKIYIFDDAALITSANLSKSAFQTNIEVGVLLQQEQVKKVKSFFESLWKISKPIRNLDGYKSAWNKAKGRRKTGEDQYSERPVTPHTRIEPWKEDTANKWFIRVTEVMSDKTENALYEATHWARECGLVVDIGRKTFESLRLGDIVYIFDFTDRNKNAVKIEEARIKDKRSMETDDGNYHFFYEKMNGSRIKKNEFDQLSEKAKLGKADEKVLDHKQANILKEAMA